MPKNSFTPENSNETAAMELSKQLCFEGNALYKQGRFQEALDAYRQDMELCGDVCGKDHSFFANSLHDMAWCYLNLGQQDFALTLFNRAKEIHTEACGTEHALTLRDMSSLAFCLSSLDKHAEALKLREQQLEIIDKAEGQESSWAAKICGLMAELHVKLGDCAQAVPLLQRKLAIEEKAHGAESDQVIETAYEMGFNFMRLNRYEQALPFLQRVLAYHESKSDATENRMIVRVLRQMAICLGSLDKRDMGLSLLHRAVEMNRRIYAQEVDEAAAQFGLLSQAYSLLNDDENTEKANEWGLRIKHDTVGTVDEELHKGALESELWRVQKALKHGASVNHRDQYGRTALFEAARHGSIEIVQCLVEHGADVNAADNRNRTPLFEAVAGAGKQMAALLLDHGADPSARDSAGRNLLMECCINHPDLVEYAFEWDIDIEQRDSAGKTALILASEWGAMNAVALLLARGANANATDHSGCTALMYSARGSAVADEGVYVGIAQSLLKAGADPTLHSHDGKSAINFARMGDEIAGVNVVQQGMEEVIKTALRIWTANSPRAKKVNVPDIDEQGLMTLPWIKHPELRSMYDFSETSDDYVLAYWKWWQCQDIDTKAKIILERNEPEKWSGFLWLSSQTENPGTYGEVLYGILSGATLDQAVVILAERPVMGIWAEYGFIERVCGRAEVDWRLIQQNLIEHDGKQFDLLEIKMNNGEVKLYHFDVSKMYPNPV